MSTDAEKSEHLTEFGPAVGPADIEAEIKAKGLTAPRVTKEIIESKIASIRYERIPPEYTFTICAITMRNGFIVTGESAVVSSENFDGNIGRKIAYAHAFSKLWALEGYLLKEVLRASSAISQEHAIDPSDMQAALGDPADE